MWFCSDLCRNNRPTRQYTSPGVRKVCDCCGVWFIGRGSFCSEECRGKHFERSKHITRRCFKCHSLFTTDSLDVVYCEKCTPQCNREGIRNVCKSCNTVFYTLRYKRPYCKDCSVVMLREEQEPYYKVGSESLTFLCSSCTKRTECQLRDSAVPDKEEGRVVRCIEYRLEVG